MRQWFKKRARQGYRGHPLATIAFYGPTDRIATKVAVGYAELEGDDPEILQRFYSKAEDSDIRGDADIENQLGELLKNHGVKSIITTHRIIGCPHEEGFDYPEGEACPRCSFWSDRDRWTGEPT